MHTFVGTAVTRKQMIGTAFFFVMGGPVMMPRSGRPDDRLEVHDEGLLFSSTPGGKKEFNVWVPHRDIHTVRIETGLLSSTVIVETSHSAEGISFTNKVMAEEAKKAIEEARRAALAPPSRPPINVTSELQSLLEMRNSGALTQSEFDEAKRLLLNS